MQNDTETQILEAAKKVFVQKGYAGARMQEIADAANINKSMLHYYFRSKELLFEKIMSISLELLLPSFANAISSDGTVIEKIERLVDIYVDTILKNPHIPIFVLNELSQNRTDFISKIKTNMGFLDQPGRFLRQIAQEQEQGILKKMAPEQIMINVMSLIVFPFVAKPIFTKVLDLSDPLYVQMMQERKGLVKVFLKEALQE